MNTRGFATSLGVAFAAMLVLGACQQEDMNRVLLYKKGVYLGKPDTALSAEQQRELNQRVLQQGAR
jgi:hypothetical protein